ncbi:hypothetical protein [Streptomyces virginiae]
MTNIDCPQQCEIPEGADLREVPRPRHNWNDVINCPNDGCEKSFLVAQGANDTETPDA